MPTLLEATTGTTIFPKVLEDARGDVMDSVEQKEGKAMDSYLAKRKLGELQQICCKGRLVQD